MPPEGISYRPETAADRPFLVALYGSTRADELTLVPWSDEQKRAFVEMQFHAQASHYAAYYGDAQFLVIERAAHPIGRIYINRTPEEICLIDIALVPEARGGGLGTELLREILIEAGETARRVTIHVERFNPAMRLYLRLGFEPIEETGVYYLMRWLPSPETAAIR